MKVKDLITWLAEMEPEADVKLYVETEGEKVNLDAIVGGIEVVTLIGDSD